MPTTRPKYTLTGDRGNYSVGSMTYQDMVSARLSR